jgi:hypothetical protein
MYSPPQERKVLENLGVDGKIILNWIFNQYDGGEDWVCLAQDRDKRRSVVNKVMAYWTD